MLRNISDSRLRERIDRFVRKNIVDDMPPELDQLDRKLEENGAFKKMFWYDRAALGLLTVALFLFWYQVVVWLLDKLPR